MSMLRSALSNKLLVGWVAGVLSSALVAAAVAAWFIFGGGFDTSASKQHLRPVAWASHTTMTNSVRKRAEQVRPPDTFAQVEVMAGAREYEKSCIACHGGPAVARAPWASALIPTPPYLIDSSRRWSRAELFSLVRDGVKMSAMPAWGELEPEQAIWNVVAFLEALPRLSAGEFARIRSQVGPQPVGTISTSDATASPPFKPTSGAELHARQ